MGNHFTHFLGSIFNRISNLDRMKPNYRVSDLQSYRQECKLIGKPIEPFADKCIFFKANVIPYNTVTLKNKKYLSLHYYMSLPFQHIETYLYHKLQASPAPSRCRKKTLPYLHWTADGAELLQCNAMLP